MWTFIRYLGVTNSHTIRERERERQRERDRERKRETERDRERHIKATGENLTIRA